MKKFFISVGEASGDYHGAKLARALRDLCPDAEIHGIGGPRMAEAGVELVHDIADLNVMGLFAVLPQLRRILAAKRKVVDHVLAWKPDTLILIDFPDFNLRLAGEVHARGVRTVYFIPPKLWAWRAWRVRKVRRHIDQVLVVFPFEVDFYGRRGVVSEYVGNPLLDDCAFTARAAPQGDPVIGVVPGSRRGEVASLLPPMLDAVTELRKTHPNARFCLPAAPSVSDAMLAAAKEAGVEISRAPLPEVLAGCDFAWVASGTASLEAALVETPMTVVYRLHPLSFAIARRLVKLDHFSLPNILAGKEVVPELLQGEVNGPRLAHEARRVLDDPAARAAVHAELRRIRFILGEPGAAIRAAESIVEHLQPAMA